MSIVGMVEISAESVGATWKRGHKKLEIETSNRVIATFVLFACCAFLHQSGRWFFSLHPKRFEMSVERRTDWWGANMDALLSQPLACRDNHSNPMLFSDRKGP